jgi:hypothetical protein
VFGAKFFHNIHWPNSRVFGGISKIENANKPFSRKLGHFFVRLFADRLVLLSSDVGVVCSFSFSQVGPACRAGLQALPPITRFFVSFPRSTPARQAGATGKSISYSYKPLYITSLGSISRNILIFLKSRVVKQGTERSYEI